jgi:hypothetical protein
MLGEKGTYFVEAKSPAAARDGKVFQSFKASPVLMQGPPTVPRITDQYCYEYSDGISPPQESVTVTGTTASKEFDVVNITSAAVSIGDLVLVVKTGQGFYVTVEGGAGGLLQFQFDEDEYETEDVPPLCANRVATDAGSHRVRVINAPCGSGVRGMDEEGYITVTDPGEFLKDRDYRELPGRTGFAMLLGGDPDEYGYSPSGCGWVITWINFFREITMIKDIIFEVNKIRIKREKIVVWDNCRLPDEIITGADCQAEDEYA